MHREERQGCNDKDNSKSHHGKSRSIRFQCTGTFGNKLFLCQKSRNGYLTDNWNKTAQDKHNPTCPVPKVSIITQPLKTGTIVGCRRGILIELFAEPVETEVIQPASFTLYKIGMMCINVT